MDGPITRRAYIYGGAGEGGVITNFLFCLQVDGRISGGAYDQYFTVSM